MTLKNKSEVLTIKEVAEFLKVSQMTLRRWDSKGLLKAFRATITQPRRYRREDVIAFLNSTPADGK